MPAYATTDDLADWLDGDLPDNAKAILRTAAYAVREATQTAYYVADQNTGIPLDVTIAAAFRDATCAQAAALITADIDPLAGGATDPTVISSTGIGSARVTYADAYRSARYRERLLQGLCIEAERILRQSNIRFGTPWVVG